MVDTYRWQRQSFALTEPQPHLALHFMTAQSLLCLLPNQNDLYRIYLEESLADNQLFRSADAFQHINALHFHSQPYRLQPQHYGNNREGLIVKEIFVSQNGAYLAVIYQQQQSKSDDSSIDNDDEGDDDSSEEETCFPGVDIFLLQKEAQFSVTFIRYFVY